MIKKLIGVKFCWICGNKFWGNKIYVVDVRGEDGSLYKAYCHKSCAEKEGYIPTPVKGKGIIK